MSSAHSTVSSASAHPNNERVVAAVSSSISRNISKDNAVQINGHIAGKVYNFNFKNLNVRCSCRLASTITSRQRELSEPSDNTSKPSTQCKKSKAISGINTEITSEIPIPSPQNLTLRSKSTNEPKIVRAVFLSEVQENFISHRIVYRLKLESHYDASAKSVDLGKPVTKSTREFVDLSCSSDESSNNCPYRFYIVKQVDFDLLFGQVFITSLKLHNFGKTTHNLAVESARLTSSSRGQFSTVYTNNRNLL